MLEGSMRDVLFTSEHKCRRAACCVRWPPTCFTLALPLAKCLLLLIPFAAAHMAAAFETSLDCMPPAVAWTLPTPCPAVAIERPPSTAAVPCSLPCALKLRPPLAPKCDA